MSEELFDVVFFGILQTGKDKETAMQNMAKLFKTEPQKLAPYFAGGRKVIKGNINAATAEKYKSALENVGLVIKLEPSQADAPDAGQPAQASGSTAKAAAPGSTKGNAADSIDTSGLTLAEVGADVLEHPVEVTPQKIDDISDLSVAEVGVDVLEHPAEVIPQKIDDISNLTMAEPGTDVLDHPREVIPQKIDEITDVSLAEPGVDIIENPKPKAKAPIPDTSELSID
jgi:hypothetical protein